MKPRDSLLALRAKEACIIARPTSNRTSTSSERMSSCGFRAQIAPASLRAMLSNHSRPRPKVSLLRNSPQ